MTETQEETLGGTGGLVENGCGGIMAVVGEDHTEQLT